MIDLHMHTLHSDGTDTVEELLKNAENHGLEIISITDHDSVNSYAELENKDIRNLYSGKIIVGAELKTHYNGIPIEVLAFGVDYKKLRIHKMNMQDIQEKALKEFKRKGKELGFIFDENIEIDMTNPRKKFASFTFALEIFKYEENKKLLFSMGPVCDEATFYREHASNKNSVFYSDETMHYISFEETINRIHEVGGLAFLAHPLLYPYENSDKFDEIDKILENYDLDGLECEYPLFSIEDRERLKQIVKKHNKYMAGGTDYHANNKPNIEIGFGINGNINIDKSLIDDWINKVKLI